MSFWATETDRSRDSPRNAITVLVARAAPGPAITTDRLEAAGAILDIGGRPVLDTSASGGMTIRLVAGRIWAQ